MRTPITATSRGRISWFRRILNSLLAALAAPAF
jgi:hypothetical protein